MKRMMTKDEVLDIIDESVNMPTLFRNCFEFRDAEESASADTHCTFDVLSPFNFDDVGITDEDLMSNLGIVQNDTPYVATGHYKTYPIMSIMYDTMRNAWVFYYVVSGKLSSGYFHIGEQGAFGFNVYSERIL